MKTFPNNARELVEVEVGGSALQLSLTGSRGFVVCALWTWALDAQKKNRFIHEVYRCIGVMTFIA